eukprot:1186772-Prorocentrum_minimum.AAC.3
MVVAFELEAEVVREMMLKDEQAKLMMFRAACGLMVQTKFMMDVDLDVNADLLKAISGARPPPPTRDQNWTLRQKVSKGEKRSSVVDVDVAMLPFSPQRASSFTLGSSVVDVDVDDAFPSTAVGKSVELGVGSVVDVASEKCLLVLLEGALHNDQEGEVHAPYVLNNRRKVRTLMRLVSQVRTFLCFLRAINIDEKAIRAPRELLPRFTGPPVPLTALTEEFRHARSRFSPEGSAGVFSRPLESDMRKMPTVAEERIVVRAARTIQPLDDLSCNKACAASVTTPSVSLRAPQIERSRISFDMGAEGKIRLGRSSLTKVIESGKADDLASTGKMFVIKRATMLKVRSFLSTRTQ